MSFGQDSGPGRGSAVSITSRQSRSSLKEASEKKRESARPRSLTRVITVDTSKARSNTDCVRLVINELGWKEYPKGRDDGRPCDIYWHSIVFSDMKDIVTTGKVNKFPGMHDMASKITLTRAISSMQRLFPEQYDFYPQSWFIPAQLTDFYEDYYTLLEKNTGGIPWFIVKPDEGSQGTGIYLINSPEQLQKPELPQIIQEYISEPFLFNDKLKFDLRIYVIIKSLNPLSIYISKEGMARFCTKKYRQPSVSNAQEAYMHLTNYSLNKKNENFVHLEVNGTKQADAKSLLDDIRNNNKGSKRLLSTVFHQMESKGVNTRKVWHDIKLIVVKTVMAMVPEIILYYENQYNGTTGPQCFHIMGFDVLLTKDLQPILLEINACPSLTISHQTSDDENAEQLRSVIDEAIKVPLVRDTLKLVMNQYNTRRDSGVSTKERISCDDSMIGAPGDLQFSLREIFPAQLSASCSQLLLLDRLAYMYMQFVSIRRSMQITVGGFRGFIKKCNLGDIITTAEIDLSFQKIQKLWLGQITTGLMAGVPFHGFVTFLLTLSTKKFPNAKDNVEALKSLLHYCELQMRYHGVRSCRLKHAEEALPDNPTMAAEDEKFQQLKEVYLLPNRMMRRRPIMLPKIA